VGYKSLSLNFGSPLFDLGDRLARICLDTSDNPFQHGASLNRVAVLLLTNRCLHGCEANGARNKELAHHILTPNGPISSNQSRRLSREVLHKCYRLGPRRSQPRMEPFNRRCAHAPNGITIAASQTCDEFVSTHVPFLEHALSNA
jgi:hypothetical protein